jgi:tetratricopeptide (TPR) repeat protein
MYGGSLDSMMTAFFRIIFLSGIILSLNGCASYAYDRNFSKVRGDMLATETGVSAVVSEANKFANEGVVALRAGDYEKASAHFNQALKLDTRNSRLHFLNAFVYHVRADAGNEPMYPLAANGYEIALRFKPDNWLAHYLYGRLLFSVRDYAAAQMHLAEAALYQPRNKEIARDLSAASYYAKDLDLAYSIYSETMRDSEASAGDLYAMGIITAALNYPDRSMRYQHDLEMMVKSGAEEPAAKRADDDHLMANQLEGLTRRIEDWRGFHDYLSSNFYQPKEEDSKEEEEEQQIIEKADPSDEMLAVDVVIIRTQDDLTGSKGVNLLNGLQLQFGVDTAGTSGLSFQDVATSTTSGAVQTITRAINIPAINYSLNILNSTSEQTRVLANPTLVATFGEESNFFSGVEVDVTVVGGATSDGDVYNKSKEIGVSLNIKPDKTDDGLLRLTVAAERTFLTTPNTTSITYTYRIDTSKTTLNANVVMDYGQTLILGGLDDKEGGMSTNKTPGLGDLPFIKNFFSREVRTGYQKSVLILLTPKRPIYQVDSDRRAVVNRAPLNLYRSRNASVFELDAVENPLVSVSDDLLTRELRDGDMLLQQLHVPEILKML